MKTEAKVGIFVFIGILFLFFLTTQVKEFGTINKEGYILYTKMDSVTGLELSSKIRINGLVGGYVKTMEIESNKIKITMFIYDKFRVSKDSIAKLTQISMIGGKYIEISLGVSNEFLNDQDFVKSAEKLLGIDEASDSLAKASVEFKAFMSEARELLDKDSRDNLKNTFANLEIFTKNLKTSLSEEKLNRLLDEITVAGKKVGTMSDKFGKSADIVNLRLDKIMKQIDSLTREFDTAGKSINKKLPDILEKFASLEDDIKEMIKENRVPLNNTLVNAGNFFKTGDSAFSKVDNYLETLSKSKLEVGLSNIYQTNDSYSKSTFSINYMPNPSRYYMLDVVSRDDYSQKDANGNLILPKTHDKSNTLISAQMGKRYDDMILRVGIIENTGGVGVDYLFDRDKLKASMDMYDFNAQNDIRGDRPHAKATLRYTFLKHIDAYIGYDNFLNKEADNFTVGVGIHFVDDDLKQLIGSMGLGSLTK